MGKDKQKRILYNQVLLNELCAKYEVAPVFVRMAIRGERESERALAIREEYVLKNKKIEKAQNKIINEKITTS